MTDPLVDFPMPYSVQMVSTPGSSELLIIPGQRSPQRPTGTQHWFHGPRVYMISMSWNGPEAVILTAYTNGVWRNLLNIPAGSGARTSAPAVFSAVDPDPRLAAVIGAPATQAFELAVQLIPMESYKPS